MKRLLGQKVFFKGLRTLLGNIGWLIEGFLGDLLNTKVPVRVPVRVDNRRPRR